MIIYFHGFGSSSNTPKVQQLEKTGHKVVAPNIPVDPIEAEMYLISFCFNHLRLAVEQGEKKFVFVGTSLGGYWAARMSEIFDVTCVLVNPSFNPAESLMKYVGGYTDYSTGLHKTLDPVTVGKYDRVDTDYDLKNRHFFIAINDQVVVPVDVPSYHPNVFRLESDDHQGTSFFPMVVEYVKNLLESTI